MACQAQTGIAILGCCGPSLGPGWASVAVVLGKWGAVWGADMSAAIAPRNGKKYLHVEFAVTIVSDPSYSHSESVDIDPMGNRVTFTDLGHGSNWPWRFPASPWTTDPDDKGNTNILPTNPYGSCKQGFPFSGRVGGFSSETVNGNTLEWRTAEGVVFKTITFSNEHTDYMVESRADSLLFNAACSIIYPKRGGEAGAGGFCQEMIGDAPGSPSSMQHVKDYPFGGSFCGDSNQGCVSSGPSAGIIVDKDSGTICFFTKRKSMVVFPGGPTCLKTTEGFNNNNVFTYAAAPPCTGVGCRLDPPLAVQGYEYPVGRTVRLREYINQACPL